MRTLSPQLDAEMNSLIRRPTSAAMVERWLPFWSPVVAAGEQYGYGHTALTAILAGEQILIRARNNAGTLELLIATGGDQLDPTYATWLSGRSDLLPASSLALAEISENVYRVFLATDAGALVYQDFDSTGATLTTATIQTGLAVGEGIYLAATGPVGQIWPGTKLDLGVTDSVF